MLRLGQAFAVRDVMVPMSSLEYVRPGEENQASRLVREKRYSVVPVSKDDIHFDAVFCTDHPAEGDRVISDFRPTTIADFISDATPLADALFLFSDREWYLTLEANRTSGLVTYWAFNSREFRVQLYAGLSRIEELARDVLCLDGCGVADGAGLALSTRQLKTAAKRFAESQREMGGNRFIDELLFSQVYEALKKHKPWRAFLDGRLGNSISDHDYDARYETTKLRNAVMHGNILFPTFRKFKSFLNIVNHLGDFIGYLGAYRDVQRTKRPN
jgi:hypothetical protein